MDILKINGENHLISHIKAFPCQILWFNYFLVRSFSYRQLNWHKNYIFFSLSCGRYCQIHLEIVKRLKKCKYVVEILFKPKHCCPPTPHNIILFERIQTKFPLLRILHFQSDFISTIFFNVIFHCFFL